MNQNNRLILYFFLSVSILLVGCNRYTASTFNFPNPVDTTDHPIKMQVKKTYEIDGVFADNEFEGARLNDFQQIDKNTFRAVIEPENFPINHSPHYAFRIWSNTSRTIELELHYTKHKHRYYPKLGFDGETWEEIDSSNFRLSTDSIHSVLTINLQKEKLYVVAQELRTSKHTKAWCQQQAKHSNVRFSTMGKSKLGRDLFLLDIYNGDFKKKDVIVIMSRQHPPEVTGYMAMEAFVEELLENNNLSNAFREKYRVLVFPLMNPDGVDLGHWRHNAGGIDMNRDWAFYHQPENRQVANFIVETSKKNKNDVILGLDFHSTGKDVFYTFDESLVAEEIPKFNDYWIPAIDDALDFKTREAPSGLNQPITKTWFYTQFKASSITYEVGDHTPRDFIVKKGSVAAKEMMKLLIFREND